MTRLDLIFTSCLSFSNLVNRTTARLHNLDTAVYSMKMMAECELKACSLKFTTKEERDFKMSEVLVLDGKLDWVFEIFVAPPQWALAGWQNTSLSHKNSVSLHPMNLILASGGWSICLMNRHRISLSCWERWSGHTWWIEWGQVSLDRVGWGTWLGVTALLLDTE